MRFNFRFLATGSAAKNPVFRWLAIGSGLNSAGAQGEQVIIGLLVYQFTGSSAWVGISLALFFAPMLFVGVPAGALADRYDKRSVLIYTELALMISLSVFGALLMLGKVELFTALVMSLLSGILRSLHYPARLSFTGEVSGKNGLVAALSLLSVVSRAGQLIGAVFAGAIAMRFGDGIAYLILGLGHALAVYCFYLTSRQNAFKSVNNTDKADSVFGSVVEYLQMLRSGRIILLLLIFASVIEIFGFSFATALPEIAVERLSMDAGGLGMMHAARAAGGLCGALLLSALLVRRLGTFYLAIFCGFGIALICLGLAPQLATVLFAIALVAVFASATDILVQGMLQLCVPQAARGRAMGAWVVALGMGPLGHLELGLLISLFGTTVALITNGILILVIGLAALILGSSVMAIKSSE